MKSKTEDRIFNTIMLFLIGTAAEKTNRICYGMEIDEHYCDVIIKRWEDYTGKAAVKTKESSL